MMSREQLLSANGPFDFLDCTNERQIQDVVQRHQVKTIYHLVALLSALGESKPQVAWDVNLGGLYRVLEVPRVERLRGVRAELDRRFRPRPPREHTPQDMI